MYLPIEVRLGCTVVSLLAPESSLSENPVLGINYAGEVGVGVGVGV